jgi:predicted DNA-binding ribbon-helix-helix protein
MTIQGRPTTSGGLIKRSILLAGHATSVALEAEFWAELEALAGARGARLSAVIADIDTGRGRCPLASSCRLAALHFAKSR